MANGFVGEWILLEDMNDLADILAATRRTVPADKWVKELIEAATLASLEAI